MNNIEKKRNKIQEIKERLLLTEDDFKNIKDKMKEYYGKYVKNNNELYNDYNLLKTKINKNHRLNKSVSSGPRNTVKFKQDIYKNELRKIIDFLLLQIENFKDFESIMIFVAKQRKIIELLKLELDNYNIFGKFREIRIFSPIISSRGSHLINNIVSEYGQNKCRYKNKKLTYIRNKIGQGNVKHLCWEHTLPKFILQLFDEMNEIYEEFKRSLLYKNNKNKIKNSLSFNLLSSNDKVIKTEQIKGSLSSNDKVIRTEQSKNLLSKLYWLYMQTCPFERGSASIGEMIFSALLQKHFDCDFRLFREPFNPHLIPDIHALTYPLEYFQSIFWDQFVSCENYKNNFSRNSNWNNYMNKRNHNL